MDAQPPLSLRLHMDCSFAAVRTGARQIRSFLETQRIADKEIWACELAFVEACNNAVQHTPSASQSRGIVAEVVLAAKHLELRINDHSVGCDLSSDVALPPAEHERGRGIFLMRSLMDDVTYLRRDSSNCLVLKKSVTGI